MVLQQLLRDWVEYHSAIGLHVYLPLKAMWDSFSTWDIKGYMEYSWSNSYVFTKFV